MPRALTPLVVLLLVVAALRATERAGSAIGAASPQATTTIWPVFQGNPERTGVNLAERELGPANVAELALLWKASLPSVADSAPVYRDGRLYFSLRDGSLVALDAPVGRQIWSHSPPGGSCTSPNGSACFTTSSPALDPTGRWVFGYDPAGFVRRYSVASGDEDRSSGWPIPTSKMPEVEKGSSALNVGNGHLYVTVSGYGYPHAPGDQGHYEGHLISVDIATNRVTVFNTLCSDIATLETDQVGQSGYCADVQSGVWSRDGAVVDPLTGNVFIATGNGPWNGATNWGDSVLDLAGDGSRLLDSYTPTNWQALAAADLDLGSGATVLLPPQSGSSTADLLIQGGKDGQLRLLNRQDLSGQGGPGRTGGELQIVATPNGCRARTAPVVWTDPSQSTWVFVTNDCSVAGYKMVTSPLGQSSLIQQWAWDAADTSPMLANNILYLAGSNVVEARDPYTGRILWSNGMAGVPIGPIHWQSPIVVDGMLVIADETGQVTAFSVPPAGRYRGFLPAISH
jgi:outer membrane protein assembly factor BamB